VNTLALILAAFLSAQEPPKAPAVLALASEEPDVSDPKADCGLLIRELVRQAILIAGRDGLRLRTRDQVLGEAFPEGATILGVHTKAVAGKSVWVKITFKDRVLWDKGIPMPPGATVDYGVLAREAEALSRGEFVEVLKAAGLQGTANAKAERGKVSDASEAALMTLTFSEQLRALRELHAATREQGEAPLRALALVRGYALLGNMTENLLYPAHKVFNARSLLYAERALVQWPETRTSRWTRAYARALTGLHGDALEDLAAAARLPAGNDPLKGAVPHWAAWIEAFCKNDDQALAKFEAPYNRGFLKYLAYVMYSGCRNHYAEVHKLREALEVNPECYDLYEAWCGMGGIAMHNEATVVGPKVLSTRIYPRVADLPGLPPDIRKLCEERGEDAAEPRLRPKLWKALAAAPDDQEPSWGVLGRLIQETTFKQACRRAFLVRRMWAAPRATVLQTVADLAPLVEDHPYRPFIESMTLDRNRQAREWRELLTKITFVDVEIQAHNLFDATEGLSAPGKVFGKKAEELAWRHGDAISTDLQEEVLFLFGRDWNNMPARKTKALALEAVCPYSPTGIAELIASDWDRFSARAAELEERYARHPQVLHELAWKYKHLGRNADAERCFGKICTFAPVMLDVMQLGDHYKERGNIEKWQETLDAFLMAEDVDGLAHDTVRKELAKYFMARKDWAKALPYAEAAGESYTEWGMECARDCQEGLANLERAHEWQKRISERYPRTELAWYFWVKRTGYGDEAASQALALKWLDSLPSLGPADHSARGAIEILRDRPKDALSSFQEALKADAHPYFALHVVLLAEELKDVEARDRAIAAGRAYEPPDKKAPLYGKELLDSFAEILAAGKDAKIDFKAWDAMLEKSPTPGKVNLPYFMGRFLELRGMKDEAKDYYKRGARTEPAQANRVNVPLAADALRRLSR
jgi:tetratricopeptide (TPR) repeat protein